MENNQHRHLIHILADNIDKGGVMYQVFLYFLRSLLESPLNPMPAGVLENQSPILKNEKF